MEFDREYWEGMTRGALYEHISKLQTKVEELEPFKRMALMSGQNIGLRLMDAETRIEELEERERWIPVSAGLKCPSCDDVGWYPVERSWGQPEGEQEQCEFCYTCPDSIFNRRAALKEKTDE